MQAFTGKQLEAALGYLDLGMAAEAITEMGEITEADQEQTAVQAVWLEIWQRGEAWPEVMSVAQKMTIRDPREVQWWLSLAYAMRRAESLAAAEGLLQRVRTDFPDEPILLYNLGCYACVQGRIEEAEELVRRALVLDPSLAVTGRTDTDLRALWERWPQLSAPWETRQ
jgi:tetratricopeptide (TPR) repeat protein